MTRLSVLLAIGLALGCIAAASDDENALRFHHRGHGHGHLHHRSPPPAPPAPPQFPFPFPPPVPTPPRPTPTPAPVTPTPPARCGCCDYCGIVPNSTYLSDPAEDSSSSSSPIMPPPAAPAQPPPPPPVVNCVTALAALDPCDAFLSGRPTPTPAPQSQCCSGLRAFLASARDVQTLRCLCPIIHGDANRVLPKPIDMIRMGYLQLACGLAFPPETGAICFEQGQHLPSVVSLTAALKNQHCP